MSYYDYTCMNYSEENGKCNGKKLEDIGAVGQFMETVDSDGNRYGGTLHLFQCPDCKTIKLLLPQ